MGQSRLEENRGCEKTEKMWIHLYSSIHAFVLYSEVSSGLCKMFAAVKIQEVLNWQICERPKNEFVFSEYNTNM